MALAGCLDGKLEQWRDEDMWQWGMQKVWPGQLSHGEMESFCPGELERWRERKRGDTPLVPALHHTISTQLLLIFAAIYTKMLLKKFSAARGIAHGRAATSTHGVFFYYEASPTP